MPRRTRQRRSWSSSTPSFEHRIDPSERAELEEAELNGELVSPPAGAVGRGDAFVLRIAERTGAIVLSNDSFQEFHGEHPWLFDRGRLVGGKPVPGVGWIFTPRLPVRGPKSRQATGKAKRDAVAATLPAPVKAAELAKAARKVAAKRARLPDGSAPQVGDVWPPAGGAVAPTAEPGPEVASDVGPATEPPPATKKAGPAKKKATKSAEKTTKKTTKANEKATKAAKKTTKKAAAAKEAVSGTKKAARKDVAKGASSVTKAAVTAKKATKKASKDAEKAAPTKQAAKAGKAVKAAKKRTTAAEKAAGASPADTAPPGGAVEPADALEPPEANGNAARRSRTRRVDPEVLEAIDEATAEALAPPAPPGKGTKSPDGKGSGRGSGRGSAAGKPTNGGKGGKEKGKERDNASGRRRRSAAPPPAVNEPLAFITFVATYPLGSELEGEVASFTSHGAMVEVELPDGSNLFCYIPLAGLGDPPPTKARQVISRGERRRFVLVALDPPRRVAELALPELASTAARA